MTIHDPLEPVPPPLEGPVRLPRRETSTRGSIPSGWAALAAIGLALGGSAVASTIPWQSNPPSPYGPVDPIEASTRQIRDAVNYRPDGGHHVLLTSLRQLRDPSLRPLFQSLVQAPHWTLQLDGILGLAELSDGSVEPFLLEQIADPRERSAGIRAALSLDLVGVDESTAMLQWKGLAPEDRLAIVSTRVRRGGDAPIEELRGLVDHENPDVSVVAALLLADRLDEAWHLDRVLERLDRLGPEARNRTIVSFAQEAERLRSPEAAAILAKLAVDERSDRSASLACLASLIAIDEVAGVDLWEDLFARETTNNGRLRAALLLLASEIRLESETLALLDGQGAVLESLAVAARAINDGTGQGDALRGVLAGGHRLSIAWAMTALLDQPREVAAPFYASIIEDLIAKRLDPSLLPVAIEAATRLASLDANRLAPLLEEAAGGDEAILEALLVGILATDDREAAARLGRIVLGQSGRRCDSLALLAIARTDAPLSRDELELLGIAASGGGRLDPALQVQAAWIFLRRSGRIDQALAGAFAEP
ncbi:MAG: hypothetical protein ACO3ZY_03210 [Phycisphaerales bacterium]